MRFFFLSMGCLSLVCGFVGIVTPLLPTTPFVLLAGYCFARGSPRFHSWITNHRRFGPMIARYHRLGVSPRIKVFAISLASFSIALSAYATGTLNLQIMFACIWALVCVIIVRLPYKKETK